MLPRLSLLTLLLIGRIAHAQDADTTRARTLYREGQAEYNLGHFDTALRDFEDAYRLRPDPAFLFNLGQCYRVLGRLEQARQAYRAFLREAPDAPNRDEVHRLIEDLDRRIAAAEAKSAASPPAVAHTEPQRHRTRAWAWITGGAAVVVAGVAIGLGVGLGRGHGPNPSLGTVTPTFQ